LKTEINSIRQSIRGQYQVAAREEASLAGNVNALKSGVMDLRNRSIQYTILQREVDTNRTLYDGLLQRYKEVGVAGGVGNNNVSVVDVATPPGSPTRPKPLLNLAIAALLGLVLGVLAALLVELLDESIQTPEDIETKLGLPLLGAIPVPPKGVTLEQALIDPRSSVSEAYYSVRTALQFSTPTGVPDVLLVTSSRAAEGKSTTSRVIAQNFARLGMRVLLVDADLRNPSLHRMLGRDNSRGLSNLLTGGERIEEVVQPTPEPNLSFIPCGPLPPNPAELLGSEQLRGVLSEASSLYDLVMLDGPPILGLADAAILANAASGVLLVVAAHETKRGPARAALRRLKSGAGGKILGAVLTKLDLKRSAYGYGYSYDYQYGEPTQLIRG
ncbi:MAG TPA: polysaccharide biosynthesis tyrosine autokinase, partial [Caulobacteraceae bacterium]|nr:polysaccharide biosynthesis tyrosine autokinase [Caulobacteraceae bacterium]